MTRYGNRRVSLMTQRRDKSAVEDVEAILDGIPAEMLIHPRKRIDCSPDPLTVACPLWQCGAVVGAFCVQFDPETGNDLADARGRQIPGPPHMARIELARAPLRPCPWVSCKYHLATDIDPQSGTLIYNVPEGDVEKLKHTCAIDIAEYQGVTLEHVGEALRLTRERMRQIEGKALLHLRDAAADLLEPDERKILVEALAASMTFSAEPPTRAIKIGTCSTCKARRWRWQGEWICRCKRGRR